MVLNRPLVIALALAAACAVAAALARVFDARLAAAGLVAASGPAILVALHEALRVLDARADEAARRSALLALALLLVPIAALAAIAIGYHSTPWP
jgi:hypothetical protein